MSAVSKGKQGGWEGLPQFCTDVLAAAAAAEKGAGAGCCPGGGTAVGRKAWWKASEGIGLASVGML